MTVVRDPAKASALAQELSALLAKGAFEPVDPQLQAGGFYSAYFLVNKKDGGFRPILDLRGLNTFLKHAHLGRHPEGSCQRGVVSQP